MGEQVSISTRELFVGIISFIAVTFVCVGSAFGVLWYLNARQSEAVQAEADEAHRIARQLDDEDAFDGDEERINASNYVGGDRQNRKKYDPQHGSEITPGKQHSGLIARSRHSSLDSKEDIPSIVGGAAGSRGRLRSGLFGPRAPGPVATVSRGRFGKTTSRMSALWESGAQVSMSTRHSSMARGESADSGGDRARF